jgi:hypothetical protein
MKLTAEIKKQSALHSSSGEGRSAAELGQEATSEEAQLTLAYGAGRHV